MQKNPSEWFRREKIGDGGSDVAGSGGGSGAAGTGADVSSVLFHPKQHFILSAKQKLEGVQPLGLPTMQALDPQPPAAQTPKMHLEEQPTKQTGRAVQVLALQERM